MIKADQYTRHVDSILRSTHASGKKKQGMHGTNGIKQPVGGPKGMLPINYPPEPAGDTAKLRFYRDELKANNKQLKNLFKHAIRDHDIKCAMFKARAMIAHYSRKFHDLQSDLADA